VTLPARPRITYISWAQHCSRSDHTARELGGTSHMVYWTALGSHPATIALKYLGQTLRTWRILAREWPDAVFVMSPSPIAVLAVYAFCAVTGKRFVIDAHSGAFRNPLWKRLQGMQFWLCRRASATIVTNDHLAELVRSHGGHTVVVPDVPVKFPTISTTPSRSGFVVACVTSFGFDEPIEAILEAARRLPDVTFYMTGDPADGRRRLVGKPDNLVLTGFLSVSDYGALLKTADVVLALTTLDHTMLRGAYEAIYQGTPVIVSNSPILRASFDDGSVHVDNTPDAITRAIVDVRQHRVEFRQGAVRLRERKQRRWQESMTALRKAVEAGPNVRRRRADAESG
jgi:glycosyltransferase involved in cell wall biosynthesis